MPELRLLGRAASAGVAFGHIHVRAARGVATAAAAGVTLPEAIRVTLDQLRHLQERLDRDGADIVQFQIELLEDPQLTAGAHAAIASGADAGAAFRQAMAGHLRVYEEAPDEYLSARAADLRDLRDRVLRVLSGEPQYPNDVPAERCILLAEDLTPTVFLEIDWTRVQGIATVQGSPSSHVSMLARARGIPLIVGLERIAEADEGAECILDAHAGLLVLHPEPETVLLYRRQSAAAAEQTRLDLAGAARAAVTRDGRCVRVYVNVDEPDALRGVPREWFDGIGLARTELLLNASAGIPDTDTQAACYRHLFDWSAGRPTTIRLLDAGADKPIAGFTLAGETNPFLGMRGVRLLLRTPEVLQAQLAAILDAARGAGVRILIPMVTIPEELAACRLMLERLAAERGTSRAAMQLGIMVETPAAALTIERFEADFFSIGTNDLTQYVMAAGRDHAGLTHLQSAAQPALLELIARVAAHGRRTGREVSVCGDAAFTPGNLEALLQAGISSVSVPAQRGPAVKSLIRIASAGSP